jgi:hypothetical protein
MNFLNNFFLHTYRKCYLVRPQMKIKGPSRLHTLRARQKAEFLHWWLVPERPKKVGRLAQLNKRNKRTPSEFVRMASAIENEPRRIFGR